MLTGDNDTIAKSVALSLSLKDYKASLLPQNKVEEVDKLLNEKNKDDLLCFVGDGINDAPVIMKSDIGISMGGVGSDAAIEAICCGDTSIRSTSDGGTTGKSAS